MTNSCSSLFWTFSAVFFVCLPCSMTGIQCCSMPSEVISVFDSSRALTWHVVGSEPGSNFVDGFGNAFTTKAIFVAPLKNVSCAKRETASGDCPAISNLNGGAFESDVLRERRLECAVTYSPGQSA